ncbi:MAG: GNAT family N-acetyltransferase [Proteobacteria bacterium]|nr:GNAT family N-acetyltransferase [Pseudomonadota bacterium]
MPDKPLDTTTPLNGRIDTDNLELAWAEAPWDSKLFGAPVLQIQTMALHGSEARTDIGPFVDALQRSGACLASCRLSHDRLNESFLLEDIGFRFIEMAYQPELALSAEAPHPATLEVHAATEADLPAILDIAGSAFGNERFHMDPRLSSKLGDIRYQNWVRSSLAHPSQRLHAISDGGRIVAFFITEEQADGTCYWHLTAVAPAAQGQGYGRRSWETMIAHARQRGSQRIQTCIVARNHRVLNLYARLGFHFPPPLTTFHWVRPR